MKRLLVLVSTAIIMAAPAAAQEFSTSSSSGGFGIQVTVPDLSAIRAARAAGANTAIPRDRSAPWVTLTSDGSGNGTLHFFRDRSAPLTVSAPCLDECATQFDELTLQSVPVSSGTVRDSVNLTGFTAGRPTVITVQMT